MGRGAGCPGFTFARRSTPARTLCVSLLELHPRVSFWKCERTVTAGRTMQAWHGAFKQGEISLGQLVRIGVCCREDLPDWTLNEARRLGIALPPKQVEFDLVHTHCGRRFTAFPELRTVFTVRDPLPAVITGLRRGGPEAAASIIAGLQFVARQRCEYGFCFCVDLWKQSPDRAMEILAYLQLKPTREIREFLRRWPALNASRDHGHLVRDANPDWGRGEAIGGRSPRGAPSGGTMGRADPRVRIAAVLRTTGLHGVGVVRVTTHPRHHFAVNSSCSDSSERRTVSRSPMATKQRKE